VASESRGWEELGWGCGEDLICVAGCRCFRGLEGFLVGIVGDIEVLGD